MPGTRVVTIRHLVVRFPVVLFDLDGTVVDSGPIILASMRHATREVLGQEFADEELLQAVGGPGLKAQMMVFAPDQADELVRVYVAHNEHMLAYAAMMTGQKALAVSAMDRMVKDLPAEWLAENSAVADGIVANVASSTVAALVSPFAEYATDRAARRRARAIGRVSA